MHHFVISVEMKIFTFNDHQNTPKELKNNIKEATKEKILFMKAFDSIDGSDNFDDENRKE